MRSYVFPVALCALLASANVQAQRMGSSNSGAPTVSQSIKFSNGAALSIEYASITWASGSTMDRIASDDSGRFRQRINSSAEKNPLGSATVTKAVTLGGKVVKAGDYKLYFTLDEKNAWHMVMASGSTKHDWKLPLEEGSKMKSRLTMSLSAAKQDSAANLAVSFGKMSCEVGCSSKVQASSKPSKG